MARAASAFCLLPSAFCLLHSAFVLSRLHSSRRDGDALCFGFGFGFVRHVVLFTHCADNPCARGGRRAPLAASLPPLSSHCARHSHKVTDAWKPFDRPHWIVALFAVTRA